MLAGLRLPLHWPSEGSTWGFSMTFSPLLCSSWMAWRTAASVGVLVETGAMTVEAMVSWYQVTSTEAQLALVVASSLREAVAVGQGYSSKHHETWMIPLYWNPPLL